MFLFLLIGNFDLIKFCLTCGALEVWGLCSAEHVRTFLNPVLLIGLRYPLVSCVLLMFSNLLRLMCIGPMWKGQKPASSLRWEVLLCGRDPTRLKGTMSRRVGR